MGNLGRRKFMKAAAVTGLAAGATSLWPSLHPAWARETMTVVEWGPPWVDGSKKAVKAWDKADINWVLHSGGAATILAKIKASWPNSPYDVIDNWSPVFIQMVKEGWAETVTIADIPNLADVPKKLITTDENGNWKNVPRNIGANFFAYRKDTCPIEIKTIEDLLDPRLKGQICWPHPTQALNMQVIALALGRGGSERDLEPGWRFLDEIVKAGNIGRVFNTTTDVINSLSTGETSVTFSSEGTMGKVMKKFPMKLLTKFHPSFKSALFVEGWVIMANSKKKKLGMDFANFMISPEATNAFLSGVNSSPANQKATQKPGRAHVSFTAEELEKYGYVPDYGYLGEQLDGWVKRFEKEVVPKL